MTLCPVLRDVSLKLILHKIVCTSWSSTPVLSLPLASPQWEPLPCSPYLWVYFLYVTFTSLSNFLDSAYKWYDTVFIFIVLYKCIFLWYIPDRFKIFYLVFCVLHPTFIFLKWFNSSNSSLLIFLSKNSEMTGNFPSIPSLLGCLHAFTSLLQYKSVALYAIFLGLPFTSFFPPLCLVSCFLEDFFFFPCDLLLCVA